MLNQLAKKRKTNQHQTKQQQKTNKQKTHTKKKKPHKPKRVPRKKQKQENTSFSQITWADCTDTEIRKSYILWTVGKQVWVVAP